MKKNTYLSKTSSFLKMRNIPIVGLYFIILLILITSSFFTYNNERNKATEQIERSCITLLQEAIHQTESKLTLNNHIISSIASYPSIRSILHVSLEEQNYEKIQFQKYLSSIKSFSDADFNIYIVTSNGEHVISNLYNGSLDSFYNFFYKNTGDFKEWKEQILNSGYCTVVRSLSSDNQPLLDMYYKIPQQTLGTDAVIAISFYEKQFYSHLQNFSFYDDCTLFMYDASKKCFSSETPDVQPPVYDFSKSRYISSNKNEIVTHIQSTHAWDYVLTLPKNIYTSYIQNINRVSHINIILSLMSIAFLGYYILVYHYKHIEQLSKQCLKFFGSDSVADEHNEYKILKETLNRLFTQQRQYEHIKEANSKTEYIEALITGIYIPAKHNSITWHSNYFCVIVFNINDFENRQKDDNDVNLEEQFNNVYLIIQNITEELLNKTHKCHVIIYHGQICALINLDENKLDSFHDELTAAMEYEKNFIAEYFNFTFTAFSGNIVRGLESINKSYCTAAELFRYSTNINTHSLVTNRTADVSPHNTNQISSMFNKENNLLNAIASGNCDEALNLLDNIITEIKSHPNENELHRIFVYDIGSQIMHLLFTENSELFSIFTQDYERIFNFKNINEFYKNISVLIKELCLHITTAHHTVSETDVLKISQNPNESLIDDIVSYIHSTYSDYNLSITSIGSHFNMAPYYISHIFKKAIGVGIAEYIGNYRIEKAKKLLNTTNATIADVASQVGFFNTKTFTRTFTKCEGIPPGKFRQQKKDDN